jgi:hypothetical protein
MRSADASGATTSDPARCARNGPTRTSARFWTAAALCRFDTAGSRWKSARGLPQSKTLSRPRSAEHRLGRDEGTVARESGAKATAFQALRDVRMPGELREAFGMRAVDRRF